MSASESSSKPKVIKAKYELQQKVGVGPLDEKKVSLSQAVIENTQVDFVPLGLSILKRLSEALDMAKDPAVSMKDVKVMLTKPVMELKANAAHFRYTLITDLANVMLNFLESIHAMDEDAINIVRAHHDTLNLIIVKKMSGNGGAAGKQLVDELKMACDRYYKRENSK